MQNYGPGGSPIKPQAFANTGARNSRMPEISKFSANPRTQKVRGFANGRPCSPIKARVRAFANAQTTKPRAFPSLQSHKSLSIPTNVWARAFTNAWTSKPRAFTNARTCSPIKARAFLRMPLRMPELEHSRMFEVLWESLQAKFPNLTNPPWLDKN